MRTPKQLYVELARQCIVRAARFDRSHESAAKHASIVLATFTILNGGALIMLMGIRVTQQRPLLYLYAAILCFSVVAIHRALIRRWVVDSNWQVLEVVAHGAARRENWPWIVVAASIALFFFAGLSVSHA